jgi:hypothetical protein
MARSIGVPVLWTVAVAGGGLGFVFLIWWFSSTHIGHIVGATLLGLLGLFVLTMWFWESWDKACQRIE